MSAQPSFRSDEDAHVPDSVVAAPDVFARLQALTIVAIASSYLVDALLLGAWALLGLVSPLPLVLYLAAGLIECAWAHASQRAAPRAPLPAPGHTLARMGFALALQIACIVLVPQVGLYFLAVLTIVFGFGCIVLRAREAIALWAAAALALVVAAGAGVDFIAIPHASTPERVVATVALMLVLLRCTLLGLFSAYLRAQVGCRFRALKTSLTRYEDDRVRTSVALHEDLGQDLAGIALALSAFASQLRRSAPVDPGELDEATQQLRTAVQKARVLAFPTLPKLDESGRQVPRAGNVAS